MRAPFLRTTFVRAYCIRGRMTRAIILAISALALAGCAGSRPQAPDPRQPQSSVTPLEYRSAFDGYRPFADRDLANWRQANEEVGTAGGHAGHAEQGGRHR